MLFGPHPVRRTEKLNTVEAEPTSAGATVNNLEQHNSRRAHRGGVLGDMLPRSH